MNSANKIVSRFAKGLESRSTDPVSKDHRAFTLLELLVVIAVLGILGALLMPFLQLAVQKAHRVQCASNLRQLVVWYSLYLEYDETMTEPPARVTRCPSNKNRNLDSYHVPGLEPLPETLRHWILADTMPFHIGHNVAFSDGRVKFQSTNVFRLWDHTE